MQTRSLLQMMIVLASQIDVPSEHIQGGLTPPPLIASDSQEDTMGQLIKINSAADKPEGAFVFVIRSVINNCA